MKNERVSAAENCRDYLVKNYKKMERSRKGRKNVRKLQQLY